MCIDYRALNALTKRDGYPLPRIDDLLHNLGDARVFTKLDLQQGYHQILLEADAVEKTAFSVPEPIQGSAHFEWLVMPFGLVNAPPFFQRVMDRCFQDFGQEVRIYMDDLLVPSTSLDTHVKKLRQVYEVLRRHNLRVKKPKCVFARPEVEFLGHVLQAGGISVAPDKIQALQRWKGPLVSVKQVRQFVGGASYYRAFVDHFAEKVAPLTRMTKKNAVVVWSDEAQQALDTIVHCLTHAPVLQTRQAARKDRITTDASAVGMGAVFEQYDEDKKVWQPCAYWSRQFTAAQCKYAPTNREWLAIVEAVTHVWRHWLQGRRFEVRTDHAPLKEMLRKPSPDRTPMQMRWYLALAPYDIDLTIIRGRDNAVADALSRTPVFGAAAVQIVPHEPQISLKLLQVAAKTDLAYRELVKKAEEDGSVEAKRQRWKVEDGLLHNEQQQVWIPSQQLIKNLLLSEEHDPPFAGHRGADETTKRTLRKWWWPGIQADAERYVKFCDRCQHNSTTRLPPPAPPQFISASRPGQVLTLDFLSGLEPALGTGHTSVLVVTDRFSRMVWFAACPDHLNAADTIHLLLTHVIARQGLPQLIISDRGTQFESTLWMGVWERLGSRVALAASKHPQTDGATERANRTLLTTIRKHLLRQKDKWERYLPLYEMAVNAATNATTRRAPFEVALGRMPDLPVMFLHRQLASPSPKLPQSAYIQQLQDAMHEIWQEVRIALSNAHDKLNQHEPANDANDYQPGDEVLLRWHPLPGQLGAPKQQDTWGGPFLVEERVAPGAYRLKGLPKGTPTV